MHDHSDFRTNAFCILGLATTATREQVVEAAERVGSEQAMVARRTLLLPRTRLAAEVGFLPGLGGRTAEIARLVLADDPTAPNAVSGLPGLNVRIALLQRGIKTPGSLEGVFQGHGVLDAQAVTSIISIDRGASGFPLPGLAAVEEELSTLSESHAQIVATLLAEQAEGADKLASLTADLAAQGFARRVIWAWERSTAARSDELLASANTAAEAFRARPSLETAGVLAKSAEAYALQLRPQRQLDNAAGLTHLASAEAARRWRGIAIDKAGENAAAALTVLSTLSRAFFGIPQLSGQLMRDVHEAEALVRARDEEQRLAPLVEAIADIRKRPDRLRDDFAGGLVAISMPGPASVLWRAFIRAIEDVKGEAPWIMMRSLAIWLHNEGKATKAALVLIDGLIALPGQARSRELNAALLEDRRTLQREVALLEIQEQRRSGDFGAAIALINRHMALFRGEATEESLVALRNGLQRERWGRLFGRAFWSVVACLVLIGIFAASSNQDRLRQRITETLPTPPAVETFPVAYRPTSGNQPLSLYELRWCMFERVRLDAVPATLPSQAQISRFNARVDGYNSVCSQYRYRTSDRQQVDREVERWRARLESEGRLEFCPTAFDCQVRLAPPATSAPLPPVESKPSPQMPSTSSVPVPSIMPVTRPVVVLGPEAMATVEDIRLIQARLSSLGFSTGGVDGVVGVLTRRALADFRRSRGLSEDGGYDASARAALFNATN